MPSLSISALPVKPRSKPARSIRLFSKPGPGRVGSLAITVGNKTETYWLEALASDWGRAFRLTKWSDGTSYETCLDNQTGHHLCDCKGHERWGHCKHQEGLLALTAK
jgi:hypothetical protein